VAASCYDDSPNDNKASIVARSIGLQGRAVLQVQIVNVNVESEKE